MQKTVDDWMTTNGGGMATSYVFALNYIDEDGDLSWVTCHALNQPASQTLGLLRWHTLSLEHDLRRYFSKIDEGDGET